MIIRNKGFNLIELMVSILVASIIVGGLYSLMTSSVVNFGFSKGGAVAGASSRRIDVTFNALLFQTGFVNYLRVMQNPHFQNRTMASVDGSTSTKHWVEDQVVEVQEDKNDEANGSDLLRIRFYGSSVADNVVAGVGTDPDGYIYDCTGQPVPNTQEMELVFFVRSNGLNCMQNVISGSGGDSSVVVIDPNVAHMRIQVGTSVGGAVGQAGANSSFYRVAGDAIGDAVSGVSTNKPNWTEINLLRYALVLAVPSGQSMVKHTPSYTLFPGDTTVKYQVPTDADAVDKNVNDRENRVHRIVNGNVQIINKL